MNTDTVYRNRVEVIALVDTLNSDITDDWMYEVRQVGVASWVIEVFELDFDSGDTCFVGRL